MTRLEYVLTTFLILWVAAPVSVQMQSDPFLRVSQDDGSRKGYYYNCGFGYAFNIPKGLIGIGGPDGYPQHGVKIALSEHPESLVWVDGSFNASEWQTLEDAAKSYREGLNQREKDVSIVETKVTRLGRLRALRLTFSYQRGGTEGRFIEEVILARRKSKEEAEIIYEVGLKIPHADYRKGRQVVERLLRTLQLKALPCVKLNNAKHAIANQHPSHLASITD